MHVYWSLVLTAARNLWHQLAIAYQYTRSSESIIFIIFQTKRKTTENRIRL